MVQFLHKHQFIIPYTPLNWYWEVEGQSNIWSSADLAYVDRNNRTFTSWLANGNFSTRIKNVDLVEVMQSQVQPSVMARGVTITKPAKLAGVYAMTDDVHAKMTALATSIASGRPLPGGGTTFNYNDISGQGHPFTSEQFLAFASACDNYTYNWVQALTSIILGEGGSLPKSQIQI